MFHEESNTPIGFWDAVPPKTSFFLGLGFAVLLMGTIGFFVLLSFVLR
ncbi:hypothetical protein HZA87_05505 [Candidatus Uhrbacteria bacterium]|nr:hypothetical protein [Candidatus Uhrbacteria bacterium]